MQYEYVIHGAPFSLFTRKLEAAMRFSGAPFRLERKGTGGEDVVAMRAATHQIPVLQTPENWMIADTTPILDLLDGRFPARRLFPSGALGVLAHVVEEVLDEWIARVMVHFRWHYPESTRHIVSQFLGREVTLAEARELPIAQWGPRACRAREAARTDALCARRSAYHRRCDPPRRAARARQRRSRPRPLGLSALNALG